MAPNVQSFLDLFHSRRLNKSQASQSSTSREASTGIEMSSTEGKRQTGTEPELDWQDPLLKVAFVLTISSAVFMVGVYALVTNDVVKLYPQQMQAEQLSGFAARVEYSLRYQTLLVFWLIFNVLATIFGRVTTKALNPLDANTEGRVGLFKAVLTNSFEQIVISVFSQLIFVSFAQPATILKIIPLVNVLQFIGRVAFFAGYPMKRSFGMMCTLIPNIVLNIYNVIKLGAFFNLY